MRILHTADWHLGRIFQGVHLTEDQAFVLERFVALVEDTQPDAVIIAGDLYDRAVPPPEAVTLLDDVLARVVLGLRVPVFAIAGNHDSPDRTGFAGRLLREGGLHLVGPLDVDRPPVVLLDEHGPVSFHLLPFAEPVVVKERLAASATPPPAHRLAGIGKHHGAALAALAQRSLAARPRGARAVCVAHGSVVGCEESESERPLWAGAAAYAEPSAFAGYCYTALGHFHRPQDVGGPGVRYSGSLLKYSFSEVAHEKGVTLVDIDAAGGVTREHLPLTPRRDVQQVEGELESLLAGPPEGVDADAYLKVVLTDTRPSLDPAGRLKAVYPNLLAVEHARLRAPEGASAPRVDVAHLDDTALFSAFFEEVEGAPLDDDERAALTRVLDAVRAGERLG